MPSGGLLTLCWVRHLAARSVATAPAWAFLADSVSLSPFALSTALSTALSVPLCGGMAAAARARVGLGAWLRAVLPLFLWHHARVPVGLGRTTRPRRAVQSRRPQGRAEGRTAGVCAEPPRRNANGRVGRARHSPHTGAACAGALPGACLCPGCCHRRCWCARPCLWRATRRCASVPPGPPAPLPARPRRRSAAVPCKPAAARGGATIGCVGCARGAWYPEGRGVYLGTWRGGWWSKRKGK